MKMKEKIENLNFQYSEEIRMLRDSFIEDKEEIPKALEIKWSLYRLENGIIVKIAQLRRETTLYSFILRKVPEGVGIDFHPFKKNFHYARRVSIDKLVSILKSLECSQVPS